MKLLTVLIASLISLGAISQNRIDILLGQFEERMDYVDKRNDRLGWHFDCCLGDSLAWSLLTEIVSVSKDPDLVFDGAKTKEDSLLFSSKRFYKPRSTFALHVGNGSPDSGSMSRADYNEMVDRVTSGDVLVLEKPEIKEDIYRQGVEFAEQHNLVGRWPAQFNYSLGELFIWQKHRSKAIDAFRRGGELYYGIYEPLDEYYKAILIHEDGLSEEYVDKLLQKLAHENQTTENTKAP